MLIDAPNGDQIEVATYEDHPKDDEYARVSTIEDMELWIVKVMGWQSLRDFQHTTGVDPATLVDKFWTVIRDTVFVYDFDHAMSYADFTARVHEQIARENANKAHH